jgi:UrcA family protein
MTAVSYLSREHRRAALALAAALAASLSIGLVSAARAAAPADAAPSVIVRYSDLDLGTDAGSSALYARIVSAARAVCFADQVDIRELAVYARVRACEHSAIANAVRDVHSTRLAVLHQARAPHG